MGQRNATINLTFQEWLQHCTAVERETLASLWGIGQCQSADAQPDELDASAFLNHCAVQRALAQLDAVTYAALERVLAEGGRIRADLLEREFGAIRDYTGVISPRTYLLSHRSEPSSTERLFVMGLLHPLVYDSQREYVIPADLQAFLPSVSPREHTLHLEATASPQTVAAADVARLERDSVDMLILAQAGELECISNRGLSKASLVRLARRWGVDRSHLRDVVYERHWAYLHFLRSILQSARLLRIAADQRLRPTGAAVEWLRASRYERQRRLVEGWVRSDWDELDAIQGIRITRPTPERDLERTRRTILALLSQAPPKEWVAWSEFLDEVQRASPDFARPNGRYDAWGLADHRGRSLDGFEHWRDVEGSQLIASIGVSLRWLGLIDHGLASDPAGERKHPVAFRITPLGAALLDLASQPEEEAWEAPVVQGTFEVIVPPRARLFDRFQISRIATKVAGDARDDAEIYRLTAASIHVALERGIEIEAVIAFLERAGGVELPPNVAYNLRSWASQYGRLRLRQAAVLQSDDPLLLTQIKHDRQLRLPPVEALNDTTWMLDSGDARSLAAALGKAGYSLATTLAADEAAGKRHDLTVLAAALQFYTRACDQLHIENDVSAAMLRRFERLIDERQRENAARIADEAFARLQEALEQQLPSHSGNGV